MPLFEYLCHHDGETFESYSTHKEAPKTRPCPKCGESAELIEISRPARRNPDRGIQR